VATAAENRVSFRRSLSHIVCGSQRLPNNPNFMSTRANRGGVKAAAALRWDCPSQQHPKPAAVPPTDGRPPRG